MKLAIFGIIGTSVLALVPFSGRGNPTPPTTRQQTIRPLAVPTNTLPIAPSQVSLYETYGYSAWQVGPGEDEGRLFLTPAEQTAATNTAQLLSFFSMSDVHIADKESPIALSYFGWSRPFLGGAPFISLYSPTILSTTHVLDAAVRTINGLHRGDPFNFGIVMGDVANGPQYNELRWFIDVMDGRYITPSSGAHLGAGTIDYQKPYQAAGLDRSIPWYQVIGNHDQFWMGGAYASDKVREAAVGSMVLNMGANFVASNATELTGVYVGVIDGTTPYGDVIDGGLQGNFSTPPTVAPDPNRRIVTPTNFAVTGYMSEFFNTASFPSGHGFTQSNLDGNSACYTFEPMPNLPLKVIVLDDMVKTNIPTLGTYGSYGSIDAARYAWLTNELQMGQDSNQLMILACHVPINPQADLFVTNSAPQFLGPSMTCQTDAQLIATLHQYPNLILLMAGHRHGNIVTPQPSSDPAHPEYGFWEVETPSLRDFPQQFRAWKIFRNSDNTLSILTTDVDPVVEPGSPADKSRGYAIGAYRLFGCGPLSDTSSHAFNAELVKTLSPGMQAVIANYGSPLPTALVLSNTPGGSFSPDWASTSYRVPGSNYTITAVAAPGYVFTGWSGSIQTNSPVLTFTMQPGLVLQANFAPLPPLPTNGALNGLIYSSRKQTIRPLAVPANTLPITPSQVSLYGVYGYSEWQVGPGEDEGRLFLTPAESTAATNAANLLSFFSMSDVHITDKESPVQIPYYGWSAPYNGWALPMNPGSDLHSQAYSPVFLSTPQVLDAAVKTIDAIHRSLPFDFGIVLGDVANCSQYNELRWFIDVMDGKYITPSSGAHLGVDSIDYQMPFQAAGLDRSIPWYEVIGNHDQMWMGVHYPTDKLRETFIGSNVLNMSSNVFALDATEASGQYMGVVDGTSPYGDIIHGGPQGDFSTPPTVAADPDRHTLTTTNSSTTNYMSEFFNTASLPVGHGFAPSNIESNSACYTVQPMANVPLKVIVLDDTCKTMLSDDALYAALAPSLGPDLAGTLASAYAGFGWMDQARLSWLTNQLQMGQDSNQLMILACHIPINPQADLDDPTPQGQFFPPNYATETNLIGILHHYPNLLLVMAGHRHANIVTPQPSPDPAHPEYGFWEVETPSLRDFPRQFRAWQILRNSDNTISILTTDVDPIVEPGSPAAKSLGYAIGAAKLFGKIALNDTSSHTFNAELVKTLSPGMQAVIANCGNPLPTALVLTNTPGGSISPDWASTSYRVPGSNYTVTATAAPGYVFTGWSGSIQTNSPVLTFTMQPGLLLQANFVPRPFVPTNGTFNGLFYCSNGVTHQSSGFITLKSTAGRKFSGKLQIGGGTYSLSGQLDLSGVVSKVIPRPHQSPLTLQLSLRGSDWMFGWVSNQSWTADLFADRAVYSARTHPAPQAGRYTLVIAGTNGDSTLPEGSGYGALTISRDGLISFAGSLADGRGISHSVPLSQQGQWPLYVPLYQGQGSVLGWLSLSAAGQWSGNLSWTKPLTPGARYPSGFAWTTGANGGRYTAPAKGSNVLGAASSQVTLVLGGGGLASNLTNAFALNANNQVKNPSLTSRLTLSFTPASGLFQGSQSIPGTGKAVSFRGVILQGQTNSAGYFLGPDQSGQVSFGDTSMNN